VGQLIRNEDRPDDDSCHLDEETGMIPACSVTVPHVELAHDLDDVDGNNQRPNKQDSGSNRNVGPGEVAEESQCMNSSDQRSLQHQN
jgi:hypothetical protein